MMWQVLCVMLVLSGVAGAGEPRLRCGAVVECQDRHGEAVVADWTHPTLSFWRAPGVWSVLVVVLVVPLWVPHALAVWRWWRARRVGGGEETPEDGAVRWRRPGHIVSYDDFCADLGYGVSAGFGDEEVVTEFGPGP